MTITRYPALVIIEDDADHEELAQVRIEDDGAALVTVNRVTTAREWVAISGQIHAALLDMRLKGDATWPPSAPDPV